MSQQLALPEREELLHHPYFPENLRAGRIDYVLLNVIIILTVLGLISILSASAHVAQTQVGDASYFFKKQLVGVVLGGGALVITAYADLKKLITWIKPLMILTVLLLIATHIPGIGVTAKGASRWLNIFGFVFQPSEIAKLVIVMFLAAVLGHPAAHQLTWRQRLAILFPVGGILTLILLQPDLGTTIVISATIMVIYFAAGISYWKIISLIVGSGITFLLISWNTPYQKARLLSFMNPWADPQGSGFHLIQSMIAIGSGGILGNGFGQSIQKLFYLPEQHTDFIFSIMAEEFGLAGSLLLLTLFVLLAQRGLSIACRVREPFFKLLATGLTALVSLQALVNLGVVTGSLPTTGLTLPFISFGSSSLIVTLVSMGLLLNVSRYIPVKNRMTAVEGKS